LGGVSARGEVPGFDFSCVDAMKRRGGDCSKIVAARYARFLDSDEPPTSIGVRLV
jgi:hypothetical protein